MSAAVLILVAALLGILPGDRIALKRLAGGSAKGSGRLGQGIKSASSVIYRVYTAANVLS